jgi:serine phosphatase RsbU (regulator of sigma subunit)
VTDELEGMRLLQQTLAEQAVKTSRLSMEKAKKKLFLLITILAIIASIVLWAVINVIKKQNIAVATLLQQLNDTNDGLETEVNKRTEELLESREDNARMGAELAITHRIQQMLLPRKAELDSISELDIAASMKPAEEAGGDYYDVLHYHDKTIITIGDVTGHGLESSVVMLMTQAAVRTLAVSKIEDPVQFLHLLNQTIFDNLHRLDSYKNLTLMLACYQNKQLTICGQHEDMLLLRKDEDSVEAIDTVDFGFPIGIEKDIEAFLQPHHIELERGDLIVLYTDGIPEAEDKNGQFYGLERLYEQIIINREHSVQVIHDRVLADIYQFIGEHQVYDDVTLMVIRQT